MDHLWQSEQRVAAKSFSESKRSFSPLSSDMAIIMTNNTLSGMGRQGGFASPKCAHFPVKIADCDLKYCILKENAKNSISGRKCHGHFRVSFRVPASFLLRIGYGKGNRMSI